MTNTPPTNPRPELPNQLAVLIGNITFAMNSIELPPLPGEPGFEEYLSNQALLQQLELAQHFQIALDVDPMNKEAASGLLKALALVERSRTRHTRPKKPNKPESQKTPTERDFAAEFLRSELLPGPRTAEDLLYRARLLGISARTLHRAKAELNIHSSLHCIPDEPRFWTWSLPEHAIINEYDGPKPRPGYTYKDFGTIPWPDETDSDSTFSLSISSSDLSTQNSALSTTSPSILT